AAKAAWTATRPAGTGAAGRVAGAGASALLRGPLALLLAVAKQLLADRGIGAGPLRSEVGGGLVLPLLLPAQGDGGAHVPGADVEGRHQVQGVRAQTPQQPTLVRGDLPAALGGDLAVEQEPGQIVLDHAEPEQVAHIGEHRD